MYFPPPNTGSISTVELIVLDSLSFHFLLSIFSLFVNEFICLLKFYTPSVLPSYKVSVGFILQLALKQCGGWSP